jgi:apolipoprotein N-acyltransferase
VPALSALLSLFIAVPCALARLAMPEWRRVAMLGGAWTLFDLARQFVGTGFPWNPLGSVWAIPGSLGDVMIQPAAWVGTPGLTLATVLLAGLPILGWRGGAGIAAVLAGWIGLGLWRLHEPELPGPGLNVVLVQADIRHGALTDRASAIAAFDRELRLSHEGVAAAGATPSIVVWPESGGIFLLDEDAGARAAIADAIRPAKGAIIGALRFDPRGTRDGAPYNSELALDPAGTITGEYDKWHLVPFGEFAPSWVPLSIQIVPGQFSFGSGPKTLEIPGVPPFGGLICYEAIYPGQVVDEANRPAWLVNVTNDSWFGNSTGPRQHLAGVRMRAVEEGLPIMRAALTGISAGFDGRGRELGRLDVGAEGALDLMLPAKRPPTSFSRLGLVIPLILAVGVVAVGSRRRYPM